MGVKSFKDNRKKVNRLVCEFVDSDNNEYRKSFEFPLNYSYDKMVNSFQDKINKKSGIYEDDDEMFDEDSGKVYEFHVNLDERGIFNADVRDIETDESIYEIETDENGEIQDVVFGFMKYNDDIAGLEEYLKDIHMINEEDRIVSEEEAEKIRNPFNMEDYLKKEIKKKSKRFNWEFDKHQPQYKLNPVTGEIEKDEEAVTKVGMKKKSGEFGTFDWPYLYLDKNGELLDENGDKLFNNIPKFNSMEEAEQWLEDNDERGTVVGYYDEYLEETKNENVYRGEDLNENLMKGINEEDFLDEPLSLY